MSFIYLLIFVLILFSTLYEMYGNQEVSKPWYYTIVTIMILTAGLAWGISPDWISYWNTFEGAAIVSFGALSDLSEKLDMEVGYLYINKIISSIGLGYGSFVLILAIVSIYLKTSTIFKYSGYVFLGLLMYMVSIYFYEDQIQVRQGLANAITIFSVRYIIDRKLYPFLICMVLAFLMHKSSIVFVFAYWIVLIKFNRNWVIITISLAIIASLTGVSLLIDGLLQLLPFGIGDKYDAYNTQGLQSAESSLLGVIVKVLTVLAVVLFDKQASENDVYYPYFRNLYIFGVAMYFFFGGGIFALRLPNFYLIFIAFMVPRMIFALKENAALKNFIYITFLAYNMALFVHVNNNTKDKAGFSYYRTIFDDRATYSFFLD
ncbi:EpsG family protein [Moheibacter sediminis]|uniref:EpsG family protein n=2 Tax=Moheibacter sediminis TaxID=1434700 RepID=A0A1W2ALT7_9FLAO|nr:EpsG family protein [Moheibacter sediminis]